MKLSYYILYWLPPVVWASLIFLFSSFPAPSASEVYWQDFFIKKTAHILEYAILAILVFRALKSSGVARNKALMYAFLLSSFYGATDEFHQSFVPGRDGNPRDVIFDTIGAGTAVFVLWKLLPKAPLRLRVWAEKLGLA